MHARGRRLDVVLEMVHQVGSVTLREDRQPVAVEHSSSTHLDLLRPRDRAEDDLGKLPRLKRPICDPSYDLKSPLDDRHAVVIPVVNETGDVLSRHLGELLLEDVLEAGENDEGRGGAVVRNDREANDVGALLCESWPLASNLQARQGQRAGELRRKDNSQEQQPPRPPPLAQPPSRPPP